MSEEIKPVSKPMGRPTVVTPEVLEKLKEAFLLGCTDGEACLFADISVPTLYNYQASNPGFLELKEQWKENPFILARQTINKGLRTDHDHALRYMERKILRFLTVRTSNKPFLLITHLPFNIDSITRY